MKKLINISILVAGIFLFSGCNVSTPDGSVSISTQDTVSQPEINKIQMKKGVNYEVHEGDKVVKNSPDTVLMVETDLQTNQTVVTLASGSATLYQE
jgi:hypothetical protein